MAHLEIKLFGEMEVSLDGQLVRFPTQKTKELFAYLVLHHRNAHPRAQLARLLWPDSDEERAKANLRQTFSRLRKALGEAECLRFSGGAVQFQAQDFWCDLLEFERLLSGTPQPPSPPASLLSAREESKKIRALEQAIALYRGPFLCCMYEDWVLIEQERLQTLYLDALEQLAELYQARCAYEEVIQVWKRVLQTVPWHERAHRELTTLYALKGDRPAALQQYNEYVETVRRELNAEPLLEMQILYENLQKGLAVLQRTEHRLPLEMPFVGRARALQILQTAWEGVCQGRGQAVLIGGEIGAGKTRCVEHWLQGIKGEGCVVRVAAYAQGLPYEPILQIVRYGLKEISSEQLARLPTFLRSELARFIPEISSSEPAAELPPAQGKSRWFSALTSFLELVAHERPVAIFFDDLHWADAATLEYLSHLVAQLKGLRLLLISTYRAEEAHEQSPLRRWLDKLGPGRSYQPLMLQRLSREETAQVLALWLGLHTPAISSWLYGQTEGNPLFMRELVHALLDSRALQRNEEGRWHLAVYENSSAYLPESLRELIGASLRRLSGPERQLVGMIAALGRSFEFDLCREILRQPRERLMAKLERLCRVGLIVEREGRYQFHHELVRQVIYDGISAERKRLWHEQIVQALEELHSEELDLLAGELAEHCERTQLWEKAITYLMRAGARAQKIYAYGEALKLFTKALKLFEQIKKPWSLPQRQMRLVLLSSYTSENVFPTVSDIIPALPEFQVAVSEMLTLTQDLGDTAKLCEAYKHQARVELARGRREAAHEALRRALALSQDVQDPSIATILEQIGRLYCQLGEYSQALESYRRAAELGVALGDLSVQGKAQAAIAVAQLFLGEFADAQQNMERAYELLQGTGNKRLQASALNNLGVILHALGQYERARASYKQAYQLMSAEGDQRGEGIVLINLGTLAHDQGEYNVALGYFDRVVEMLSITGLKGLEIETYSEKGRVHLSRGELELSLECSERAIKILGAEQGIATEAQRFYFTHYQILQANQRPDEARISLQKAYEELQRMARQIREETLRVSFLENVSINRQIVQAWRAAH